MTDRRSISQPFRPRARVLQLLPALVWYRLCSFGPSSAPPPIPRYGSVHPKLPDWVCEMQNGEVPRMTSEAPSASVRRDIPIPPRYLQCIPIRARQAKKTRRDGELGDNARTLIETLHRAPSLDEHYANIRVINRDPGTGDRRGHQGALSVVFHAIDSRTGRPVALKFFDPDVQGFGARYRMDLFARECKLLERLVNKPRCLQLVQPCPSCGSLFPVLPLVVRRPSTADTVYSSGWTVT